MKLTRRDALKYVAPAAAGLRTLFAQAPEGFASGPFQGTRESLRDYRPPDWFRDAKFGIWAHWGPQSAAEYGDWYARNMYIQGHRQYEYHVKTYGHPSKFGFKDIIATWKGDQFDPDHLIRLYKKAGAKYFVSMGVHHDNFDLWNSRHHRWNSVQMGPKKDIVGLFRKAALREGLRFGVSEHLWIAYKWFSTAHHSDSTGPLAGVPYDGNDPAYADLYVGSKDIPQKISWDAEGIPDSWKRTWQKRIKDLVDQYQPDLLYTDGPLPFEEYGLALVAHLYNSNAARNGGRVEAVYNSKRREDCAVGTCVLDVERGLVDRIWSDPWQTDTCVGQWHYNREAKYKTPKFVIDLLVDIVSRNGNLLLNFPLPNSGALDAQELSILEEITRWMQVNSEGIYATRPWKIFGEGAAQQAEPSGGEMHFNERSRKDLTASEVRFTAKGKRLYVFVMGWPEREVTIRALGRKSPQEPGKIEHVELLGFDGKLAWSQQDEGLRIEPPQQKPSDYAVAFRVTLA